MSCPVGLGFVLVPHTNTVVPPPPSEHHPFGPVSFVGFSERGRLKVFLRIFYSYSMSYK